VIQHGFRRHAEHGPHRQVVQLAPRRPLRQRLLQACADIGRAAVSVAACESTVYGRVSPLTQLFMLPAAPAPSPGLQLSSSRGVRVQGRWRHAEMSSPPAAQAPCPHLCWYWRADHVMQTAPHSPQPTRLLTSQPPFRTTLHNTTGLLPPLDCGLLVRLTRLRPVVVHEHDGLRAALLARARVRVLVALQ